jgi:signal transduction histidine kinase/CheY-like chemotaxis protein
LQQNNGEVANKRESYKNIELELKKAYTLRGNNLNESLRLTELALQKSEQEGYPELIAKSLSQLGLFHMIKGNFAQSLDFAEKSIHFFEATQNQLGIASAKYTIAGVNYKSDNYHLGMVYLIDSLNIYKIYDDHANIARCHKSLGTIYEYFGDQAKAIESYEASVNHAKLASDESLESNAYNPLSGILIKEGKLQEANSMIEKAIEMKLRTGDTRGYAFSIYGRGKVNTAFGNYEQAEKDFLHALTIHKEFNEKLGTAMAYAKLGELYLKKRDFEKAEDTLLLAKEFSYQNKILIIKYKSNYLLYQLYRILDNHSKALDYLETYLKEKEAVINTQSLTIIENYELINRFENLKRETKSQKEKAEILEKKKQAEELASIKQDFLSTMSHEIRTPLNAVITIAGLLEQKAKKEDLELIQSLNFASKNLLNLINDILDFTKLENQHVKLENEAIDLARLLEQLQQTYIEMALEKGLSLNLKIDQELHPFYLCDEGRLSQILNNLIGNAIKYTLVGSIEIEVEVYKKGIQNDTLRFSIKDTGIGIEPKFQETIFNSFTSAQETLTKKIGGTGLGLAIVKKLAQLFNTQVELISSLGNGSIFYFDLLLEKAKDRKKTKDLADIDLKLKKVLLAEDNQINAMVAIKLLKNWSLNTTHAVNGLKAIELASIEKFDYILMDIHMPEMNGFDAAKWIRENENPNQNTPILALTADIMAEFNTAYFYYFNRFLRKPIESEKLLEFFHDFNLNKK